MSSEIDFERLEQLADDLHAFQGSFNKESFAHAEVEKDVAELNAAIAALRAQQWVNVERAFKAGSSAGYSRAMAGTENLPSEKAVDFEVWRGRIAPEVQKDEQQ
ncbi:MAG: hypothetical protein ACR2PF_00305 [Rhizobiaceae bacterium]